MRDSEPELLFVCSVHTTQKATRRQECRNPTGRVLGPMVWCLVMKEAEGGAKCVAPLGLS